MAQPKFCILIPIKDINPPYLIYTLRYLQRFLRPESIVIVTPMEYAKKSANFQTLHAVEGIIWIDENSIYEGLCIEAVRAKMQTIQADSISRAGWYLQQFLKMAFALYALTTPMTPHIAMTMGGGGNISHYLIWDCDAIVLKELCLFLDDTICFEKSYSIHKPYFDTLEKLHIALSNGDYIRRVVDFSFVTENMMVEVTKMQELIMLIESQHKKPFWEAILENIESKELGRSGFSEFETYGNFIAMMYPNSFKIVERKRERHGREFLSIQPNEKVLQWCAKSYDVVGIESWDKEYTFFIKLLHTPCMRLFLPTTYRKILNRYIKFRKKISTFYKKTIRRKH